MYGSSVQVEGFRHGVRRGPVRVDGRRRDTVSLFLMSEIFCERGTPVPEVRRATRQHFRAKLKQLKMF